MSGVVEPDIDLETFQAQIDSCMAHTSAIVESWVKPSASRPMSSALSLAEFEASLRRPLRLGAGAKVPDGAVASSSKDAAKLKGRLVGSKRPREGHEKDNVRSKLKSDDEDDPSESRGGSIQKKSRIDPFAMPKKSNGKDINQPKPADSTLLASSSKMDTPALPKATSSSDSSEEEEGTGRFVLAPESSPATSNTSSTMGPPANVTREDTPATSVATPVPSSPATSLVSRASVPGDNDPTIGNNALTAVLNIHGPPAEASPSKRKRRKRNKKKNKQVIAPGSPESAADQDQL